jgi:cytochrome c oxidase assembly protein subunit 15
MVTSTSADDTTAIAASRGSTVAVTIFRLAGLFTFLATVMGAVVSATKSGAACPTWPGCRPGDIAPPLEVHPVIEFTHRAVAGTAGPLILAAALIAFRLPRPDRWVRILPWVGLVGAIVAALVGRLVVLRGGVPVYVGAADLFCALAGMTAMVVAAVLASRPPAASGSRGHWGPVTTIAAVGVGVLMALHVTGIVVAGPGSYTSSVGWPLWQVIESDLHPWLQIVRLVIAGLAAVLVVATAVAVTRMGSRAAGVSIAAVLVAELALGAVIRVYGLHQAVAGVHSVLAVVLVAGLGLVGAAASRRA